MPDNSFGVHSQRPSPFYGVFYTGIGRPKLESTAIQTSGWTIKNGLAGLVSDTTRCHLCKVDFREHTLTSPYGWNRQWRRQDLLRGGAKMEIMSWGTHGGLRGWWSSCSMTNSFVTNAVLTERAVSCWHLHQLILQTTQYLDSWLSDLVQSKLQMKLSEVEGGTRDPVPYSWRRQWKLTPHGWIVY